MSLGILIFIGSFLLSIGASNYCKVTDPCGQANSSQIFEPYARFQNCQYNNNGFCDRYITPQWYRFNEVMLTHCPSLLSCGSLYPVWLNGSLPTSTDGIVDRKACKVGFESCCTRTYDIQIKHCGSFYAYCLAALDTCPERYCFGKQGTCEIHTSSIEETTTQTTNTTPSPHVSCLEDPCNENNVVTLKDSRSIQCEYKQGENRCDNALTLRWYKAETPMVTECPGLLSCGAIYPVWLNGTIPTTGDGVVTRKACQRGFDGCCSKAFDVEVKNCGRYTAYCLRALTECPSRYCFGTEPCDENKEKNSNAYKSIDGHNPRNLEILLGIIFAVLVLILAVLVFSQIKPLINGNCKTGSAVNILQAEKIVAETRVNPFDQSLEDPPPYSS